MGQGSYILAEWDSVQEEFPDYQRAMADLESRVENLCTKDWGGTCGYLVPGAEQYGRVPIIPALFDGAITAHQPLTDWRQEFTATGHQMILSGCRAGNVIPEGFKVAWMGLMFPNKQLQISEIRWQISTNKYGRVNIEEIQSYNKPAVVFEDGFILNEEKSFELYGNVENEDYQRINMLGAVYYKVVDDVLGDPGSAI